MKCSIVAQLKRNLVKVIIKCYPIESRRVLKISQSATKPALVEEVHETDSTEFIKVQTLSSSDRNLTGFNTNSKKTTNGFLVSRSLPFKCIFILHRHHAKHCKNPIDKKNSDLVKEFKNITPEPGCLWSWCWITNSANGNSRLKNTNKREKMGQFRIIKIHTWLGGCRE